MKPSPGTIIEQRVKCGKPNCHCATGEQHRAFYRFWRERGRLRKAYVRRADVESAREACQVWKEHNQAMLDRLAGNDPVRRRELRREWRSYGLM